MSSQVTEIIHKLNEIEPNLINEPLNISNLQESVNSLHVNFADNHLVKKRITKDTNPIWEAFNNSLHALENLMRSKELEERSGEKYRSIVFTWKNNFKEPLAEEEFSEFTVGKEFGTMYINYCQVGRHFMELFLAQDEYVEDKHILPLKYVSADSYLWLGPTSGKNGPKQKLEQIQIWFEKHKERFHRLGYHWGDPKLAIGWVPVADIVIGESRQDEILNTFERFESVRGIEL